MFLPAFIAFLSYFATAVALLAAFIVIYVRITPYREFQLIGENNQAAAVTLSGAVLGFTFPLLSAIYYTLSLAEMILWAAITCFVQMAVFLAMRKYASKVESGNTAAATLLATLSISVGMINALCISH